MQDIIPIKSNGQRGAIRPPARLDAPVPDRDTPHVVAPRPSRPFSDVTVVAAPKQGAATPVAATTQPGAGALVAPSVGVPPVAPAASTPPEAPAALNASPSTPRLTLEPIVKPVVPGAPTVQDALTAAVTETPSLTQPAAPAEVQPVQATDLVADPSADADADIPPAPAKPEKDAEKAKKTRSRIKTWVLIIVAIIVLAVTGYVSVSSWLCGNEELRRYSPWNVWSANDGAFG